MTTEDNSQLLHPLHLHVHVCAGYAMCQDTDDFKGHSYQILSRQVHAKITILCGSDISRCGPMGHAPPKTEFF